MKYLLDTHVLLWAEATPELIRPEVLRVLSDPAAELFLSAASAQEIAIKWRLGKLSLPVAPALFLETRMARSRLRALPVSIAHAAHVATLPDIHGDPFDRLIVTQAQLEGLTILTRNREIPKYEVQVLRA